MQEDQAERKINTNSKASAFTSIVWVLELIDWTLVNWVFLLQVESEDRRVFSRKMKNWKKGLINTTERQKEDNTAVFTQEYEG